MKFPLGMNELPNKALELMHSLNGTKQAGYNWHGLAHDHMTSQGFKRSTMDPCYYWKWSGDEFTHVVLFVDDFQIGADKDEEIENFISQMRKSFPIKSIPADHYLGMTNL